MANRKQQIKKIQDKAMDLAEEIENLVSELEESFENLPESLQYGEKGDAMQARIDTLNEWKDSLTDMAEQEDI